MNRVAVSVVLILASVAAFVAFAGLGGLQEILIAVVVVAISGFVPFLIGVAAQVVAKNRPLPLWAPWMLAALAAAVRLVAPELGGLTMLDSELAAIALTLVVAGSFAELGSALVRVLRIHRSRSTACSQG